MANSTWKDQDLLREHSFEGHRQTEDRKQTQTLDFLLPSETGRNAGERQQIMTLGTKLTGWGLLATMAVASVSPALADRASDQKNKNNMRNLAIAGAAVAAYGLLNHNNTATLLGAAGAAIAGSQYEKDRKQQSEDNYGRYYHYRNGQSQYTWNNRNQDNRNQDNRSQYRPDRNNRDQYNRDDQGQHSQRWNDAYRSNR